MQDVILLLVLYWFLFIRPLCWFLVSVLQFYCFRLHQCYFVFMLFRLLLCNIRSHCFRTSYFISIIGSCVGIIWVYLLSFAKIFWLHSPSRLFSFFVWWHIKILRLRGTFNKFPFFFVQAFKIVVDPWKFSMLLLYILWYGWLMFMISSSNEQLQQQLEYTLLNPDCHSWWISKMQSDTLVERYAKKFCFKLGKMPQKRMECFRLLFDHLAWMEHQFLSGIRDTRKAESLWGMMSGVRGVRESIQQSWLAKGLGLGLLCWGFKGVQEEIPREEASTLQIGSVAFPPEQCTSQKLHPCHRLFDQDSSSSSL